MALHPVQRVMVFVVLAGLGFFVAPLLRGCFPTDADWEQQIRADAETALQVLRYDPRLPEDLTTEPAFWAAWDARLDLYDAARRADLRARLLLPVDFLEAEWTDVAEIHASAVDPRRQSAGARSLRERLPGAFGPLAGTLVRDADALREEAYAASTAHSGADPDLPDFRAQADAVRAWLPPARAPAELQTTPAAERP